MITFPLRSEALSAREGTPSSRAEIVTCPARSLDRSVPGVTEDPARIAVCCPSGHVQTDSSSPFTGDLLLARTCNQGKIVDICRPSAGSGLPEGRRSPLLPLFCVLRVPLIRFATAFMARCTNTPEIARTYAETCTASSCCSSCGAPDIACERSAIQIYNEVNDGVCVS